MCVFMHFNTWTFLPKSVTFYDVTSDGSIVLVCLYKLQYCTLFLQDLFILLDLLGTKDVQFYSYFQKTDPWYARMVSYERRLNDLGLLNKRPFMFNQRQMHNPGIEDDHIPFLERGVPIIHLIPVPFPKVWHKNSDNASALDFPTIKNLNLIMRAFVADYLHIVV